MSETTLSFFRRHAAHRVSQLTAPVSQPLEKLEFPQRSVWHYLNFDGIERGPGADDFLFRNITRPILFTCPLELATREGGPKDIALSEATFISDYRRTNRRMRPIRGMQAVLNDPNSLMVVNYCGLGYKYRYPKSAQIEYFRWYNAMATWVSEASELLPQSELHHHYLMASTPRLLASVGQFEAVKEKPTVAQLKQFPDRQAWLALELYHWLGGERKDTLFSSLPVERLHQINIIYREGQCWWMLNLGSLYSMRKGVEVPATYAKSVFDSSRDRLAGDRLQRTFLHFLMEMSAARTVTANTDEVSDIAEDQAAQSVEGNAREELLRINQSLDGDDLTQEERDALLEQQAKLLDRELAKLNDIRQTDESPSELSDLLSEQAPDPTQGVMDHCESLLTQGLLTAKEYARFQKLSKSYLERTNPYTDEPVEVSLNLNEGHYQFKSRSSFPRSAHVIDETMAGSVLEDFDRQYVRELMPRHNVAMVMGLQNAGIAVTEHDVQVEQDVMGRSEVHTVRLVPVEGAPSTLAFKVPLIEEDGTFTTNGVKYRLRKQFGDLPIRKVDYNRVALTSYYGKAFITRGRKKLNDYGAWLSARVMGKALDPKDPDIKDLKVSNVFDKSLTLPRSLSALSREIRSISARGFDLHFSQEDLKALVGQADLTRWQSEGFTVIGLDHSGQLLGVDAQGAAYFLKDGKQGLFGSLEAFLNIPVDNAPVEFAECMVFGKPIPVGVMLAYQMGLSALMDLLKVSPRRVLVGERMTLGPDEWALRFSDERLVFSRQDRMACMVLAGFQEYHRTISNYSVWSFDKSGVYLNLLEANGVSPRYLREVKLMNQLFVDPITKDILKQMKEPQTFRGLLLRSCQLLLDDSHLDELDPKGMRIKGYERVSGAIYNEMVQAVRTHEASLGKSNLKLNLNPFAIMKRVTQDPAKSQVAEINPIESLKQIEAVTFAGEGGRSKQSMTKRTRAYHKNNVGVISESTVDSSDVGINVYTSANPNIDNMMGVVTPTEISAEPGLGRVLSTSALLTPSAIKDDAKRVNFIGIQRAHVVPCAGYTQAIIQTGYEEMVAHRSPDIFAVTAKKKGRVVSVGDKGIIVEYEDGEQVGYEVGRRFGNASGLTIAHEVVTALRAGDTFEVGDAICYNRHFFEPSFFNRKRLAMKDGIPARVVLWESAGTLEDASSISPRLADKLMTKMTKIKDIVVRFDQSVEQLVTAGTAVEVDTVLCLIQDESTSNSGLFTEENIDTLRMLGTHSPRAGSKGVVERVEVYYHGELEDLSPSLIKLARSSDRAFKERAMQSRKVAFTGKVDTAFRIKGDALPMDNVCIRVYITADVSAGVGDKGVFGAQLKTVFSALMERPYLSEDRQPLDAIFGGVSIDARIVESAYEMGTAIPVLRGITQAVLAEYDK